MNKIATTKSGKCVGCGKSNTRMIGYFNVCTDCLPAERVKCNDCGVEIDQPATDKPYRCVECAEAYQVELDKIPKALRDAEALVGLAAGSLDSLYAVLQLVRACDCIISHLKEQVKEKNERL